MGSNFGGRKRHMTIRALLPTGDVQRIKGEDKLQLNDGILIMGTKGGSDTDRRLMQERQFIMDYASFKENLISELSPVGSYDDIAERDGSPEANEPSSISFVRDASADPVIGRPIWALYIYDEGAFVLLASQDDVLYYTDLGDGVLVSKDTGNFIGGVTSVEDLRGLSFSRILDLMLFVSNATIAAQENVNLVTVTPAGNIETGTTVNWEVNATFSQGQITNGDGSPGPPLVGSANLFTFTNPDATTTPIVAAGNTQNYTAPAYKLPTGTTTMSVKTDYDAGTGLYYDSGGNPTDVLDAERVAGNVTDPVSQSFNAKPLAFWAATAFPTDSATVRVGNQLFLSTSATGVFNMTIPAGVTTVWFSVPTGKTIKVLYVESSNADVTSEFAANTFNVVNGGGTGDPVSYDTWESTIPGVGYPADATYNVTIS